MVIFNAFGHMVIGIITGILTLTLMDIPPSDELVMWLFLFILGSLLPDIDHPKSTLGKFNPFSRFMKHRGKSHTLLGCFLLSSPLILLSVESFCFTFIGAVSHLVGDKIYSLVPFTKRRHFKIRIW